MSDEGFGFADLADEHMIELRTRMQVIAEMIAALQARITDEESARTFDEPREKFEKAVKNLDHLRGVVKEELKRQQ